MGASVYTPDEALAAIAAGLRILQIPHHALDQRHARAGVFEAAKAAGVTVMARQPFCRGLLLHESESATVCALGRTGLPMEAANAGAELLWRWRTVCARHGISPLEAGLRFSLASPADLIVLGVSSVAQLEQDVAIVEQPAPGTWPACYADLCATFKDAGFTLGSVCTGGR